MGTKILAVSADYQGFTCRRSESVIVRNPELVPGWLDNIQRLRTSYMAFQLEQQRQSDYYHHQHQALPSLLNVKRN